MLRAVSGFMADVASRLANSVQLPTDAHKPYLAAVEDAFGGDIDYAMLTKIYGANTNPEKRYSRAVCLGCKVEEVSASAGPEAHLDQLHRAPEHHDADVDAPVHQADECVLEKLENHAATVALYFMHYNFS